MASSADNREGNSVNHKSQSVDLGGLSDEEDSPITNDRDDVILSDDPLREDPQAKSVVLPQ